jgi:thiamine-monophosphate kinase
LRRDGAKVNDEIWVSGTLGMAALGLANLQGKLVLNDDEKTSCTQALQRPQARVELGLALRHIAHSAIDISDGLLADFGHILKLSKIGATLNWEAIPKLSIGKSIAAATLQEATLGGGDDYELCFTAPESVHEQIIEIGKQLNIQLSCIGVTHHEYGLRVLDGDQPLEIKKAGYDHFK